VEGASAAAQLRVPDNAVALVIHQPTLDLPNDLPAGRYRLVVVTSASGGRQAQAETNLQVAGQRSLARALYSHGIVLRSVDTGIPLLQAEDATANNSEQQLLDKLLEELRTTAPSAGQVLPEITRGRFQGLGGQELFETSNAQDVRAFLNYLLARTDTGSQAVTFVDAYAQWALDGAPEQ
ncbi:MAG TPA: hypothetical protein VF171_01080, partial [Trueperaceae bacterium]